MGVAGCVSVDVEFYARFCTHPLLASVKAEVVTGVSCSSWKPARDWFFILCMMYSSMDLRYSRGLYVDNPPNCACCSGSVAEVSPYVEPKWDECRSHKWSSVLDAMQALFRHFSSSKSTKTNQAYTIPQNPTLLFYNTIIYPPLTISHHPPPPILPPSELEANHPHPHPHSHSKPDSAPSGPHVSTLTSSA